MVCYLQKANSRRARRIACTFSVILHNDNKNGVIVLVLRVGRGQDTSRESRNEGPYLEFAGDVRIEVSKKDSGLGLWRNETLLT